MIWGYHYFRKHPYQLVSRISSINCTLGTRVCQGQLDFHPTFPTSFVNLRTPSQTGKRWSNFFPIHKDNGSLSFLYPWILQDVIILPTHPIHSWEAPEICDTFALFELPQNGSQLMITCLFPCVFCLSWVPYQAGTQDVSGTTKQHRLLPMEGSTAKVI